MVRLSVNVNKVATVRNSRGGAIPSVLDAVAVCLEHGAPGITVHPRADQRHIRPGDVREIAALMRARFPGAELNIEGDPRSEWLALVHEVRPAQATLVPVREGEVTSEAGFPPETDAQQLREVVAGLQAHGIRVSVFVDPEPAPIDWAKSIGADRVELYTEPYARAFARSRVQGERELTRYAVAARAAASRGLGVNAGHDLDLSNLASFRPLPHLDEVSIGHALISRALFVGLGQVVREYLQVLA